MVYAISKKLIAAPAKRFWVYSISGLYNIPKDEPFILASNHITMMDGFVLACIIVPYIDKKLHFYVKSEYFRNTILNFFLNFVGCIPVYVGKYKNIRLNKIAHKNALSYLKKGDVIGIFPEGKISLDSKLGEARKGLGRLALDSNAKILPIGISCRGKIICPKKFSAGLKGYSIKISKPIKFKRFSISGREERIKYISDETMKKIKGLVK